MKRSEMLSSIANIIHNYRRATEVVTSDELAHMILEMQEANGMSPPGYMKPLKIYEGKQYPLIPGNFQNESGIWCDVDVKEWESENE